MKKLLICSMSFAFLSGFAGNAVADNSAYILIAHNSYAMTVTKIARANNVEQCEKAKSNFEKEFPPESEVVFKCIPVPSQIN